LPFTETVLFALVNPNKTIKMANQNNLNQKIFNLERAMSSLAGKGIGRLKKPSKINKKIIRELSVREIDVLKLICEEHTNQIIGDKLFISKRTVEGHRQRILEKIGAKNTVGLVVYAIVHKIHTFFPRLDSK
jgi:DNA-binding CsgD family transcriptional regulator